MKIVKLLLAVSACALLLSCGRDEPESGLALVPADTPYVFAAMEPLPPDMRSRMYRQADAMIEANMPVYRGMVENLTNETPRLGSLLGAMLDEFEGKSIEQVLADTGVDPAGQWLVYGIGLSPVERIQLADPAAFEALLGRLEKAWGEPVPRVTVEDSSVRKLALADSGLALYAAIRGNQAIFAFLPDGEAMLRQALGFDLPEDSLADSGALAELADARGYTMQGLGYVDLTRLPGLLVEGGDPLLTRLSANPDAELELFPAACRADLDRIAARVPMISAGYSEIQPARYSVQTDIGLAPDIASAFSGLAVPLPGLGADSDAMADLAAAWPIAAIQSFLRQQVEAIQARPFDCNGLVRLNQMADELGPRVGMLGIVPWTNLRGFRLRIDRLDLSGMIADETKLPTVEGAIVLASTQPASLVAMVQSILPALFATPLEADGEPVALKSSYLEDAGVEASAAMTAQAIAVAVGENRAAILDQVLHAPTGGDGEMMRMHVSGDLYRNALDALLTALDKMQDRAVDADEGDEADEAGEELLDDSSLAQLKAARKQIEHLEEAGFLVRMENSGLVMEQTTVLRDSN